MTFRYSFPSQGLPLGKGVYGTIREVSLHERYSLLSEGMSVAKGSVTTDYCIADDNFLSLYIYIYIYIYIYKYIHIYVYVYI